MSDCMFHLCCKIHVELAASLGLRAFSYTLQINYLAFSSCTVNDENKY